MSQAPERPPQPPPPPPPPLPLTVLKVAVAAPTAASSYPELGMDEVRLAQAVAPGLGLPMCGSDLYAG